MATDRLWQDQEPLLPASPVLFDYKRGRINAPEADLSVVIVVLPLVSLMVDQCPVSRVFQLLFLVETRGLTRSTLPMNEISRLARILSL